MKKITLELPVFHITASGVECVIDPTEWTDGQARTMALSLIEQGIKIILQRKDTTEPDVKKAVRKKAAALQSGSYTFGGGGGGSRSSATDKAWIQWLNAKGCVEEGKEIIKKTLTRAQQSMCRKFLIQEFDAGTEERKDVEQNIGKHLSERFDAWVTNQEENDPLLKMCIELQKAMATAKSVSMT